MASNNSTSSSSSSSTLKKPSGGGSTRPSTPGVVNITFDSLPAFPTPTDPALISSQRRRSSNGQLTFEKFILAGGGGSGGAPAAAGGAGSAAGASATSSAGAGAAATGASAGIASLDMGLGADGATDDDGGDEDIDVEERKDSTAGAGGVLLDEGKCMSALNEEGEEIMCTFCELTLTPGDHFVCEDCKNVHMCENCFLQGEEDGTHKKTHKMTQKQ